MGMGTVTGMGMGTVTAMEMGTAEGKGTEKGMEKGRAWDTDTV